jgi:hypothetical protein
MKQFTLFVIIGFTSLCAWSEPRDGTVFPMLTVNCDAKAERLEIVVSYVQDLDGLHDPSHGRYDFEKLVHWEEIPGTARPDYKSSVETFRQICALKGESFEIEIMGKLFAGSPMQECGIAISATVQIYRGGRPFLPRTVLDDCFEHQMPPIQSIVVDLKTRQFQVHREKYIGG